MGAQFFQRRAESRKTCALLLDDRRRRPRNEALVRKFCLGLDDFTEPTLVRRWARLWHLLRNAAWELWRNRLATMGAVMVLIVFLVALLAPFLARYDPVKQNYREMLQGPSAAHYFGTDKFGRDIWSRVVWGAQRSVLISVLAVMVGMLCGVPLGTLSGFYGGKLDAVLMRVVDAWLAFPGILFYLIAATIIQAYKLSLFWNTVGLIIALGVAQTPAMARLVRGTSTLRFGRFCRTVCRQSSSRLLSHSVSRCSSSPRSPSWAWVRHRRHLTGEPTSTWHASIWRRYRTWRSSLAWRFPLRS